MNLESTLCPYCEGTYLQPEERDGGGETWEGTGDKFG